MKREFTNQLICKLISPHSSNHFLNEISRKTWPKKPSSSWIHSVHSTKMNHCHTSNCELPLTCATAFLRIYLFSHHYECYYQLWLQFAIRVVRHSTFTKFLCEVWHLAFWMTIHWFLFGGFSAIGVHLVSAYGTKVYLNVVGRHIVWLSVCGNVSLYSKYFTHFFVFNG